MVKINFDASVFGKKTYYELVARDADGFILGGRMGFVEREMQIEWAKMLAIEKRIKVARSNNWNYLELKSDCASLVNCFNNKDYDLTTLGHHMREIYRRFNFFNFFKLCWAPRCCNSVADNLCKWAKTNNCIKNFRMDYLVEIHNFVLNDAIN
ncbi:hypothetical protein J1N35_015023 [Gossypium stocksii]|uniref:RNase H type-1 domain-containing protein n=1 Tax=Gossypium stocksii TaxID=47602 RepID=A0A9D3VVD8_9ROSI|nr:hypothetical protein J1N35_015023 [Gossypium stocksii]